MLVMLAGACLVLSRSHKAERAASVSRAPGGPS